MSERITSSYSTKNKVMTGIREIVYATAAIPVTGIGLGFLGDPDISPAFKVPIAGFMGAADTLLVGHTIYAGYVFGVYERIGQTQVYQSVKDALDITSIQKLKVRPEGLDDFKQQFHFTQHQIYGWLSSEVYNYEVNMEIGNAGHESTRPRFPKAITELENPAKWWTDTPEDQAKIIRWVCATSSLELSRRGKKKPQHRDAHQFIARTTLTKGINFSETMGQPIDRAWFKSFAQEVLGENSLTKHDEREKYEQYVNSPTLAA